MNCPRCDEAIGPAKKRCPGCGAMLCRNVSGVMKTSAVMISAGGEESFFQSVADVPEALRRQLVESTEGENSGTIVIADRAGKERIRREKSVLNPGSPAPERHATELHAGDVAAADDALAHLSLPAPPEQTSRAHLSWLALAGFLLVLACGGAFAAFFGMRW